MAKQRLNTIPSSKRSKSASPASKRAKTGDSVTVRLGRDDYRDFVLGPDVDLDQEVVLNAEGQRIDQGWVDRRVDQVRRRSGRPSLTEGGSAHSPRVSFRVPQKLADRAEQLARREGKSLSELGRDALERYVEQAG